MMIFGKKKEYGDLWKEERISIMKIYYNIINGYWFSLILIQGLTQEKFVSVKLWKKDEKKKKCISWLCP